MYRWLGYLAGAAGGSAVTLGAMDVKGAAWTGMLFAQAILMTSWMLLAPAEEASS